jgi:DoxX-like protein
VNIFLWVLQALLALAFFAHGLFLLVPPAEMLVQMNAVMSTAFRIFLGIAEVLAAIGLILPGVTRILPWLVPSAAAGIMTVMISATILHVTRGEIGAAVTTTCLLAAATFVAYMRWKVLPIAPRIASSRVVVR